MTGTLVGASLPASAGPEPANCYADELRANAYAALAFPGTYALAFRDLPTIIGRPAPGAVALDFGCGTGRSTRFLRSLGFRTVGVDIAPAMLEHARRADPDGDYRLLDDGRLEPLSSDTYDLILSAFTFDNVPQARKLELFTGLRRLLRPTGRLINVVSSEELYRHEWASFTTSRFPENGVARTGDVVRTVMLDVGDPRPVEDVFCSHADYEALYRSVGLAVRAVHRPLASEVDGGAWVNETKTAPWVIYVVSLSVQGPG